MKGKDPYERAETVLKRFGSRPAGRRSSSFGDLRPLPRVVPLPRAPPHRARRLRPLPRRARPGRRGARDARCEPRRPRAVARRRARRSARRAARAAGRAGAARAGGLSLARQLVLPAPPAAAAPARDRRRTACSLRHGVDLDGAPGRGGEASSAPQAWEWLRPTARSRATAGRRARRSSELTAVVDALERI